MRSQDLIMYAVVFVSMATAVLWPHLGVYFQDYLLYFMMALLFLSFLKIEFRALLEVSSSSVSRLALLTVVKLALLPAVLYGVTASVLPDYAIPVLLLSGISSGVVGPFIGSLMGANVTLIIRMVIVTSVLVPFTLPVMVEVLAGATIEIPLGLMVRLLAWVVFIPMAAVLVLRRASPNTTEKLIKHQFSASMVLFTVINLGVFSKYSHFFFQNPGQLLMCLAVAFILSALYYACGMALIRRGSIADRLASGVSFALMNNVLVIVFASRFFGPLSPTLAAMYMFPYYLMIVPVKMVASYASSPASGGVAR